jgi:hypothetical protein
VGDRSRGRFAKPADFLDTMVPRTGGYTYGVGGLGFVPRPRTIFCRAVLNPLRFATFPSLNVGLTCVGQARVRNRASIMARHMFGDEGDGFAAEQVGFSSSRSLPLSGKTLPYLLSPALTPRTAF